jgi:hypothetical protein
MRRLALAASILAAAACAGPRPCTQALCPLDYKGASTYRVEGWTGSVTVSSGTPALPIVSDSLVAALSGETDFVNAKAVIKASEGSSFRFVVSSGTLHVPSLIAISGDVTVALSTAPGSPPAQTLTPGAAFFLPASK